MREHNTSFYSPSEEASLKVKALDFPALIRERAKDYDVIIVKMDIEGGEYDVLDSLIDRGAIGHIHMMFCEFHSQYMEPVQRKAFQTRERRIKEAVKPTDCDFVLWR